MGATVSMLCVSILAGVTSACSEREEARKQFHHGRDLVVTGRYDEAVPVLENYVERFPRGRHASRAAFFLGKAHLGMGDLDGAAMLFERTAAQYPGTLEARKCPYKLALIQLLRGDRKGAFDAFSAIADAPASPLAPEAEAMRSYWQALDGE